MTLRPLIAAALVAATAVTGATAALAQGAVVASVNGKQITENDVRLAEAEIGADLGNLPEATKRRVLVEYLIENQLLAEAAEADKLGQGQGFDERMAYWRRRALRDSYFDKSVKGAVSDVEAKKFYDAQVGQLKPQSEIEARHILVESQDKAKEIFEKIAHGADFAKMAAEFSKDPGTKDDGGKLGYFGRGQMVPQFEEAAFKLKEGEISQPVETQFGWHLIKVEARRDRQPPSFDQVKDRIVASMIHSKAQEIVGALRAKAKLEYLDPAIKKMIEEESAQPGAAAKKQ